MRVTIEIPDGLHRALRRRAAADRTSMRMLVIAALRQHLGDSAVKKAAGFKLRDGSFGGEGMTPEFRDADWSRLREEIYRGRGGEE